MNKDGYPDEHELQAIRDWDYLDLSGLMDYVQSLWRYDEYFRKGRTYYRLSTGGWSGNESLIYALKANTTFWAIYWWSSQRGGHYVFKILKGGDG